MRASRERERAVQVIKEDEAAFLKEVAEVLEMGRKAEALEALIGESVAKEFIMKYAKTKPIW